MNPHELKALQVRLTKARAEEGVKKEIMQSASRDYENAKKLVASLEVEVAKNTAKDPVVSEHALLRYIERIYGIDLKEIEDQILTPCNIKAIKTLGNGKYPLQSGGKAVVKGGTVVSITD